MRERVIEKILELDAPVERVWREHGRYAVRVREVDPRRRLVWSWVHEPGVPFDDAPHTTVAWELTSRDDGGTTLRLRESGFLSDVHHSQNNGGWDEELAELVALASA